MVDISARHSRQTQIQGLHAIVAFTYANAAARVAATGFNSFDVYKLSLDLDDGTFWIITAVDGSGNATWQNLVASSGGGVGGDLSGTLPNPTVIDLHISGQQQGSVLFYNGSHWVVLNPSTDGYVLTTHNTGANPTWSPVITDLSVANQAKGDLLFFDGTNWVVLAAGEDGYVLTAKGTNTNPEWDLPTGGVGIAAGTQHIASGTVSFNNLNGISFGMSNFNQITASYTVPNTNGLISNINISGGTTSNNLSAFVFSNSNNVSFGLNGSTITGSIPNQTAYIFSNSNGLSFGTNGSTITGSYTVPSTAGLISNINISAGTTSNNLSAVTFSNSNGLSFGLNGSIITGSYTVPTQSNQTEGMYALGNTVGQSSSSTFDARTMSISGAGNISLGYSGNALIISGSQSNQTANVVVPSAGTQTATSGTVVFSNSNGITFGMSGNSQITASYTVPNTAGLISNINFSAGTTSNNLNAITFSNSNGISFGLNGSTVTASYTMPSTVGLISAINVSAGTTSNNLSALTFSNSNGLSFGLNGSTITGSYTVPTQTNQTEGMYAVGNTVGQSSSSTFDARTMSISGVGNISVGYSGNALIISAAGGGVANQAGTQTATSGTVIFSNSNGISFGMSNSSIITASYTVPSTAGLISNVNISAGTTSNNLSAFVFSNSNNVSFGLNGSTVTATVTVPAQTNQTVGLYALGNTTQNSSTTLDARSLSFNGLGAATVGYSNGSIQISVPNALTNINISAGTTSNNLTALTFNNANGISFGLNASIITASYTVPTQSNQTEGLYAIGNTVGQSSSSTFDARTMSFSGAGIASVGYSGNALIISVPSAAALINISAGTTSNNLGAITFSNSNNVSFGLNGSTLTGSIPNQTNQTIGLYALGNTTQNSSTTLDARTLSFNGLGAATVGYSNGSIQISVPVQTAQTQSLIQAIYDGANSITTGTIRFTNANGVSFSINGQTISGSVAAQTVQTVGLYALGNTTQNSSTTLDARTLSFNGLGGNTVGYSNGSIQISGVTTAGLISKINVSGGTTSNNLTNIVFSNSNNISFGLNGSTITASASRVRISQLHWPESPWQTNFPISNASFSLQHFDAKIDVIATQANLLMILNGNTNSSGALTISLGIYTMAGSTMSLVSSDSRNLTWTSGSQTSASSLYGGVSGTRYRTVALNSWSISAGDYVLGMWFRTTNNGTWNAFGVQGPTIVGAVDVNETQAYLNGYSTSSFSTAMIASVNVTDTNYVRTGGNAFQQPGIIFLGTV